MHAYRLRDAFRRADLLVQPTPGGVKVRGQQRLQALATDNDQLDVTAAVTELVPREYLPHLGWRSSSSNVAAASPKLRLHMPERGRTTRK